MVVALRKEVELKGGNAVAGMERLIAEQTKTEFGGRNAGKNLAQAVTERIDYIWSITDGMDGYFCGGDEIIYTTRHDAYAFLREFTAQLYRNNPKVIEDMVLRDCDDDRGTPRLLASLSETQWQAMGNDFWFSLTRYGDEPRLISALRAADKQERLVILEHVREATQEKYQDRFYDWVLRRLARDMIEGR
jgi:hypothetical protein